nr:hypothetical protein [Tanacetum cinerariifolium]
MTSFDYRLNPLYPIKECSSCGALYTMDYCCSKGNLEDKIIYDLDKTPNLSQRSPQNCPKCGNPVNGHYCQGCALLRKIFKEDLFTSCIENGILQDSSEPSNGNTNKEEEKQIEEDQVANARYWKIPTCYGDDDDDYNFAITPNEPDNSLSMGDEHLDTISATKSDEFIKSSVENLFPNPSESEGDIECDVPAYEVFTTFLNILFDSDYDFYSSDDQSFSNEEFLKEIYSNPLFDEEIISIKIDPHPFNVESDLIESTLNHDSSIISSSSKLDSLFDEFAGKLTLLKSILLGIDETDCDPEEETHFIKRLLYDNSSPRPSKEFVFENSDADIESFSPFPIPVEDSDSLMEEIDLSFTLNYLMPPGIEEDDYDSKRDILILEELLSNNSLSLPENESFHFDIPSFCRPLVKPPMVKDNKEKDKIRTKPDKTKSKREAWKSPESSPTKSKPSQNQESIKSYLMKRELYEKKWFFRNKKDEIGVMIKNKAILVAQEYTQKEQIDYDEVFAPVARIEVIRLFLAYASFKDFVVYQMNVKSAFLYGKIEEEAYKCLQVKQKEDRIFISQDKYVNEILNKFDFFDVKIARTPMETYKTLLRDEKGEDVDEHWLAILGVVITSEDLNLKFLRSLPPKWNTHVVVWMNKVDIETMSIDDLYNNFKIVEQEVKKSVGASTVNTDSSNVNTVSSSVNTANISDNAVYAFMVENPNGSNLLQEDLEQIHKDNLEAIDLKWQLSLLSMRPKKCRAPRNKDGQFRYQDNSKNQESSKRTVNVEDTSSKAMLAIDGVGFDWSDIAEEQIQTNMALMAFSDSKEKEQVSDNENSSVESSHNVVKETVFMLLKRGNQRNWNDQKSNKLGNEFVMYNKAWFVCGSFDHIQINCPHRQRKRMVTRNNYNRVDYDYYAKTSHPTTHRNMTPIAVLLKSGLKPRSTILLKIPRKDNMYSFDIKNIVPKESLTCLVAKATLDESMLWYRRPGHINFKNINKLVKENLVRGLPLKQFENDQTCVAYLKGKQHRASCSKRKHIVARTPQQNGVAKIRNRTLIEAARIMLADSKLPTTFWAETVSSACYVQNKVLIVKPHNKTPYELFRGFKPTLSFMKPFRCHVTIRNTLHSLRKFDGKSDEGFFIGYSLSSKAYMVYNTRTRKVEENLHVGFLENKPMLEGNGIEGDLNACTSTLKEQVSQDSIVMPIWKDASYFDSPSKDVDKSEVDSSTKEDNTDGQQVNTVSPAVNTVVSPVNTASPKDMSGASHSLEATHIEFFGDKDALEVELGNILNSYTVPTTPNTRIYKNHLFENVIGDMQSSVKTRRMVKPTFKHGFFSAVYEKKTHEDLYTCLFACFLSQEEPKRISKALSDPAWIEAMQEEFLQFKLQKVWILMDLPKGLVAQRNTQEKGIDYDEVFALVAKIKAIRLLLAYASFMGFMVYQMDVKSAFLYGQIEEEKEDGIFISQDKYVDEILRKFNYTDVKTASIPFNLEKPLLKDGDANDVDAHLYRSMIGSLMYLTTSRPDIMFAVCACARFQVTPKTSHLLVVKRIFRYLKGKPTLGLWQCKKQTVIATSTTKAEYVAAASCCGQVLWIQNQLLDYRHHFIRDCNAKKLIQMVKIDIDHNVADLLTKGFGAGRTLRYLSLVVLLIKVGDEDVHKELGDRMERAATTASGYEAEQDVMDLHRLVEERYTTTSPEGYFLAEFRGQQEA